jgi:hypothetical protein
MKIRMKRNLLTLFLTCAAMWGFAQGQVQFKNFVPSAGVDAPVYLDFVGGFRLNADNPMWRAALIGGPATATPTSFQGLGTLQTLYNPYSTVPWLHFVSWSGGDGYVETTLWDARAVPGVDWGGQALVQMVAWEGPYTTWDEAYSAAMQGSVRIGFSDPLTIGLPSSVTDPSLTYLVGLQPFAIGLVPEPTVFALAGLGAGMLLLYRRHLR